MTPSQELCAVTAHLNGLLAALASSLAAKIGDDGLIAAAIEYASLELDDLRGTIEGERAHHRDEQGLVYFPDDDALEAQAALDKAVAALATYTIAPTPTLQAWSRAPLALAAE